MCSCTTAKCAGCTCGCFHTPATRRAYWQGVYAAGLAMKDDAIAAIDALEAHTNGA